MIYLVKANVSSWEIILRILQSLLPTFHFLWAPTLVSPLVDHLASLSKNRQTFWYNILHHPFSVWEKKKIFFFPEPFSLFLSPFSMTLFKKDFPLMHIFHRFLFSKSVSGIPLLYLNTSHSQPCPSLSGFSKGGEAPVGVTASRALSFTSFQVVWLLHSPLYGNACFWRSKLVRPFPAVFLPWILHDIYNIP